MAKGISLRALGRHREAVACLDEAIRLDSTNAYAYGTKGKSLQMLGEQGRMRKGQSLQMLGEHQEAIACLDKAIGLKPDYFAHATKGQSLQELGRHQEAIACLDGCDKAGSEECLCIRDKGRSLQELCGRHREAMACLDRGDKAGSDERLCA